MRNHNSRPHIELIDLITQYQLCTVKKRFEIYRKQLTKSNKIYAFISLSVIVSRCVNRKKIHLIVGRYCGIGDTLNPAALSVLEEHLFIHTRACVPSSTFNFFFRFFFFCFVSFELLSRQCDARTYAFYLYWFASLVFHCSMHVRLYAYGGRESHIWRTSMYIRFTRDAHKEF